MPLARTYTAGGTDVTEQSTKYMWLKRHLKDRGVPEDQFKNILNQEALYTLALETGVLTTARRPDAGGDSGLPLAVLPAISTTRLNICMQVDAFEGPEASSHMDRADQMEQKITAEEDGAAAECAEPDTPPEAAQVPEAIDARFEIGDTEAWRAHLRDEGFVVLKGVANQEQICHAKTLIWDQIEASNSGKVIRSDLDSWSKWRVDRRGFMLDNLPQSEGAWYLRGLAGVKECFATIWEQPELLVSMDAMIIWKPWWLRRSWLPRTEG